MHRSTPGLRTALPALLACALAACGDPAPVGPDATGAASLKRGGSSAPVSAAARLFVTGLEYSQGSTVGPGGALFVTEGAAGRISRVDPRTGAVTTYASGLPATIPAAGIGGAVDVAFIGGTAYVLVTLVGADVGGSDAVGIYRVDGPGSFTLVADIGAFNLANPPSTAFFIPTGVQYALEAYRGALLVTDGHHNRVLHVALDGGITEFAVFGNIVPTGLEVWGNTVLMAEAGPIPHLPENGRVVAIDPQSGTATEVARGARLLVDVERGRGGTLFALAQGFWNGPFEGAPAQPNTGALVRVNGDGTFTEIVGGLDRPTSFEIIGNTAYVITIAGEIWTIADIASPPFGRSR